MQGEWDGGEAVGEPPYRANEMRAWGEQRPRAGWWRRSWIGHGSGGAHQVLAGQRETWSGGGL